MAGFNLPITAIPPQLLAEMARAAFKPPALMSGGGGGGMGGMGALPQSQGFNVGQGMAGMGQGLGMLAGSLNQPSIEEKTKGQMLSPSNASYGDLGGPGGTYGQGIGGWFGNLFGGGKADGGEVIPGKYYTVGEQGPETFVPAVPGYIVPNDQYPSLPGRLPPDDQYSSLPGRIPPNDPYLGLPGRIPPNDQYPSLPGRVPPLDFFGGRVRR